MQSKQESVTKEEESLTRFGWNGKMERERENDERREEEEESRGKEVFVLVVGVLESGSPFFLYLPKMKAKEIQIGIYPY